MSRIVQASMIVCLACKDWGGICLQCSNRPKNAMLSFSSPIPWKGNTLPPIVLLLFLLLWLRECKSGNDFKQNVRSKYCTLGGREKESEKKERAVGNSVVEKKVPWPRNEAFQPPPMVSAAAAWSELEIFQINLLSHYFLLEFRWRVTNCVWFCFALLSDAKDPFSITPKNCCFYVNFCFPISCYLNTVIVFCLEKSHPPPFFPHNSARIIFASLQNENGILSDKPLDIHGCCTDVCLAYCTLGPKIRLCPVFYWGSLICF